MFFFRNRQLGRARGQIAISQAPARWRMDHDVELSHALRRRDVPLLRGRLNQHEPCGRAGLSHDIIKASDRMGSIRVLITIARIADRLVDLHSLPVGVQLIGNQ